jgi:hypothetical protein
MKRLQRFCATVVMATASINAGAQCTFGGFVPMPIGSTFAIGPALYPYFADLSTGVLATVNAAVAAWNSTDANGRIQGWSSWVSSNDCPHNQPFQIGMYPFFNSTCPTLTKQFGNPQTIAPYEAGGQQSLSAPLGFADYWETPSLGTTSPIGTRSVSLNANLLWTTAVGGGYLERMTSAQS